ncbi:hypothetical protein ACFWY9_42570 [Amycolatopsis sp. NPDC059027]|uniref:hypothetical protein n=1 Tax=unclassified Amycolatopsis TaxID=2618356 RepID=UPI00367225A8
MNTSEQASGGELRVLYQLHTELTILTPALTVAPGTPETATMTAGLRETTAAAAELLAVAEPDALDHIRRALVYAAAHDFAAACSDLAYAQHRLSVLLRRDDRPRRSEAAREPTLRWRIGAAPAAPGRELDRP